MRKHTSDEITPKAHPGAVTKKDLGVPIPIPVRESFKLRRSFSERQLEVLRAGHIGNMDDKWSWFMEGNALFICRNWMENTVFYRIDLSLKDNNHSVAVFQSVKRDPDDEKQLINKLLDCRIGPSDDQITLEYYDTANRVLTVKSGKKDGNNTVPLSTVELAPKYSIGEGYVLENSDGVFQRVEHVQDRHVFQNTASGDETTVLELKPTSQMKKIMKKLKPSDELLALYWLVTDTSVGLMPGRKLSSDIEKQNGITYGSCTGKYNVRGKTQPVSVAVCHGHTLLIFGDSALIKYLRPAGRGF